MLLLVVHRLHERCLTDLADVQLLEQFQAAAHSRSARPGVLRGRPCKPQHSARRWARVEVGLQDASSGQLPGRNEP